MIVLADKISKSFGGRLLYAGVSLQLNAKEKWALVGPNGAGKTTLLRIIMGQEVPDEGSVSFSRDCRVGYLEQEMSLASHKSALQEVVDSAKEIRELERLNKQLEKEISATAPGDKLDSLLERYAATQDLFERLGGYELNSRASTILSGLGFPQEDFDKPAQEFSGGWQMRIALSKLLLRHPDLLLLDEPTNHLDLESVRWLEQFIAGYDGAVLLVSHDRSFMDACVTHVAALENRRLSIYVGNYKHYLSQREANLDQLKAKRAAQERDIAHMQVFIDKFRYKPTKAKQVQERIKRVEKIESELVILPEQSKKVRFSFPEPARCVETILEMKDLSKSFGDHLIYSGVNLSLYRGDHVALVGPNGAGKSTLMKLILGLEQASSGSLKLGKDVRSAYYAQHQLDSLCVDNSVLQELDSVAPSWTVPEERRLLGAFLFHGDDIDKKVEVLSGGEKARLALAKMLVCPEPLLCLDEPTNHLDIDSVDVLENALKSFPGTIVLISHDEHLVRAISNKIIDVRDQQVRLYDGDFDYYLFKRDELLSRQTQGASLDDSVGLQHAQEESQDKKNKEAAKKSRDQRRQEASARREKQKTIRAHQRRIQDIESALHAGKKRYDELMQLMASQELYADQDRFNGALKEYDALSKKLPALEDEWLELSQMIEEME